MTYLDNAQNKMTKIEHQNDSYQNTNRNKNSLVPIFSFLLFSVNFNKQNTLANNNIMK